MEKSFVSSSSFMEGNSPCLNSTGRRLPIKKHEDVNLKDLPKMNIGNNFGFAKKEHEGTSFKGTTKRIAQHVKEEIPDNSEDEMETKPSWLKTEETSSFPSSASTSIKCDTFPSSSNLKLDDDDGASRILQMQKFIDQLYDRMDDTEWGHFADYVLQKKRHCKREQGEVVGIAKVKEEKGLVIMECCLDDAISTPDSDDLNEPTPQIPDNKSPYQITPTKNHKPPRKMKNLTTSKISRKNHTCQSCMKCFSSKRDLTLHRLVHLTPEEKAKVKEGWKHSCYFCAKRFRVPSRLETHLLVHTGEKPFRCDQCGQQFNHKSNLTKHKPRHTNRFSCGKCSKCFTQKCHLKRHEKRVHLKLKDVPCSECGLKFTTKSHMMRHSNVIHRGVRHLCPHCHKTFSQKGNLGRHVEKAHPSKLL